MKATALYALLVLGLLAAPRPVPAQPSGGPYGPVPQTYAVPEDANHVYYVAPDGKAEAPGTTLAAPTALGAAIERVVTGDAIVMRGGTYRTGGLRLRGSRSSRTGTSTPSSRGPASRPSGRPCAATSGGRRGRPSSRRSRWAGGGASGRACARPSTGSTTTWSSSTASC